jgi:hypothetical protein
MGNFFAKPVAARGREEINGHPAKGGYTQAPRRSRSVEREVRRENEEKN